MAAVTGAVCLPVVGAYVGAADALQDDVVGWIAAFDNAALSEGRRMRSAHLCVVVDRRPASPCST